MVWHSSAKSKQTKKDTEWHTGCLKHFIYFGEYKKYFCDQINILHTASNHKTNTVTTSSHNKASNFIFCFWQHSHKSDNIFQGYFYIYWEKNPNIMVLTMKQGGYSVSKEFGIMISTISPLQTQNCHMLMECSLMVSLLIWSCSLQVSTDALLLSALWHCSKWATSQGIGSYGKRTRWVY